MTKQWLRAHKKDPYYKAAKSAGYRSRAAYKLNEINKKFKIFRPGDTVLDLGASPGGWSQVALERVGGSGLVIGVDIDSFNSLNTNNMHFLRGDITDPNIVIKIQELTNARAINIIISDIAPNISGHYSMDQARSIYLAENVLKLTDKLLNRNGKLVLKVFEGEDFLDFKLKVKQKFRNVRYFSPKASRAKSSEIYVIGMGFIAGEIV
jgi:23S rRNA (uridine2552-2'-O)-methyltransferase